MKELGVPVEDSLCSLKYKSSLKFILNNSNLDATVVKYKKFKNEFINYLISNKCWELADFDTEVPLLLRVLFDHASDQQLVAFITEHAFKVNQDPVYDFTHFDD